MTDSGVDWLALHCHAHVSSNGLKGCCEGRTRQTGTRITTGLESVTQDRLGRTWFATSTWMAQRYRGTEPVPLEPYRSLGNHACRRWRGKRALVRHRITGDGVCLPLLAASSTTLTMEAIQYLGFNWTCSLACPRTIDGLLKKFA